ncbi:DUF748 domain-containing protein [Pseudoxanthomonas sp.]|uniref:DUF748 domain-containing protein n=1 Tax=Pseudoxanthomonas sp. TaxID=1871049 RepID=UPI00262894FA|nr:DUF748 domain-containing protein [Pseudoxanthomonas sp.]WDS37132.1 MAG: DUF748 domain-containing protein [Pseudoxanthomonas sp.]
MAFWTKSRWFLWAPVAALALVGLYAALGFWALPRVLRSQATDYVSQVLHKPLTLGEIRFNPFTFQLDVADIAVGDAAGKDSRPLVALRRLHADFQVSSLWRRAYVFREIILDGPYAHALIRPDGSLNLAELSPPSKDDGPLPSLQIWSLTVTGGKVDFADWSRRVKPEKTLSPIDFTLRNFSTTDTGSTFTFGARTTQGERFGWSGNLSLQPLASSGAFRISALQARSVYAFLEDSLPMQLSDGTLELAGRYDFTGAGPEGVQLEITLAEARANQLALRARGVEQDWVVLPSAALDNTRLSLGRHAVQIDAIRIDGMKAQLWREADGHLNLERLLASPPPAANATPAPANADSGWTVNVGRFALEGGDAVFDDRAVRPAARFQLAPLAVTVKDASLDLARPLPVEVRATLNKTTPVELQGTLVPDTLAADLQVKLGALPLQSLLGYLPRYPALTLKSGRVEAAGKLVMQPTGAPGPDLSFKGDGAVTGLNIVERADGRDFLSWERVQISGIDYSAAPDALTIREIRADKASARVLVSQDGSVNLVSILSAPSETPVAKSSTPAQAEMPLRIGQLTLRDATVAFADYSIDPNFSARIDKLSGRVRGLSTATDSVADIDLKGQVINQYSPVTITGGTRPFAFDKHTDIAVAFRNIDLPLFNPYSGRFAGYSIAKGKLTTELHYRIDDRKLQASHHVILDQLEWGAATDSKDKVSLPVRLATSLLKDRHGVIDLDLPVTGTLDDPKFRIGPVIWQVIKNVLTKVVMAPFSFLGSLFAGAEDAQFVDFAPGSSVLPEAAGAHLASLAEGLADRPTLRLDIPAGTVAGTDDAALAQQRLQAALAGEGDAVALDTLPADDQVKLLSKLYRQVLGHKPEPPDAEPSTDAADATRKERHQARDQAEAAWLQAALLAHYAPAPADLQSLGRARADAIQDALLAGGKLDPARVFITTNKAPVVQAGAVRLELGLE